MRRASAASAGTSQHRVADQFRGDEIFIALFAFGCGSQITTRAGARKAKAL